MNTKRKMFNPYKRLEELNKEIHELDIKIAAARSSKEKKGLETEQFYFILEQLPIDKCVKYFDKEIRKLNQRSNK